MNSVRLPIVLAVLLASTSVSYADNIASNAYDWFMGMPTGQGKVEKHYQVQKTLGVQTNRAAQYSVGQSEQNAGLAGTASEQSSYGTAATAGVVQSYGAQPSQ
jgi:hypothetical protein